MPSPAIDRRAEGLRALARLIADAVVDRHAPVQSPIPELRLRPSPPGPPRGGSPPDP